MFLASGTRPCTSGANAAGEGDINLYPTGRDAGFLGHELGHAALNSAFFTGAPLPDVSFDTPEGLRTLGDFGTPNPTGGMSGEGHMNWFDTAMQTWGM